MMKPVKAAAMVARQAMQITSSLSYMSVALEALVGDGILLF